MSDWVAFCGTSDLLLLREALRAVDPQARLELVGSADALRRVVLEAAPTELGVLVGPVGDGVSSVNLAAAIARDGKIKDLQVARKSGDDTFDFAATSAVINAGPFAPLPMYYEKDELTVSVEFRQEI